MQYDDVRNAGRMRRADNEGDFQNGKTASTETPKKKIRVENPRSITTVLRKDAKMGLVADGATVTARMPPRATHLVQKHVIEVTPPVSYRTQNSGGKNAKTPREQDSLCRQPRRC